MSQHTHASQATVAGSFSNLSLSRATTAALTRMGISQPTPIQAASLPLLLDGRDVIGQARTGSGKTLAFVIPAVELIDPAQPAVQVLVLTPTRELAVQIGSVLDDVTLDRNIRSALIVGGRTAGPQIATLRRGAHVVIGTPGRILDLLNQGALTLSQLRFLVLDEADEMLDRGFAPDVERILGRTPRTRQTALFSATVPGWVSETANKHLARPVTVAVDPDPDQAPPITHVAYDLPADDKLVALKDLLDMRGAGSIIVFGRTKHGVKKLARRLEQDGYPVGALQGNLSQNARDRVMEQFRSGEVQILVATNVAARGLDISSVDQVINLELPESPELLTHRIGRTGRMGREGRAITLLGPEDGAKWRTLERALGRRIPRLPWPGAASALQAGATRSLPAREERSRALPAKDRNKEAPMEQPRASVPEPGTARAPRVSTHSRARNRHHDSSAPTMTWADGRPISSPRQQTEETERLQRTAIVCSGCGERAEVPFQPDPTRPVYCRACHHSRRSHRMASAARS